MKLTRASVPTPSNQPIPAKVTAPSALDALPADVPVPVVLTPAAHSALDGRPSTTWIALQALAVAQNLCLHTADGPHASGLTAAILADRHTLVVPPGQDPAVTFTQACTALAEQYGVDITPCPDGRPWCTSALLDHADPREHIHRGPEHEISGSYGSTPLAFQLTQWDDDEPTLTFQAGGEWRDLGLEDVDRLQADLTRHCQILAAVREQLAALIAAHRGGRGAVAL
ncbi:DUF6907 domain-containing protein [Streptomyces sp. NPDC018031]|uniref:DUF6907 domain-containing protein n=1 Tax=Streptomyces sp. NPDC018031 TaxID=3365033 RepID=UPI0037B6F376